MLVSFLWLSVDAAPFSNTLLLIITSFTIFVCTVFGISSWFMLSWCSLFLSGGLQSNKFRLSNASAISAYITKLMKVYNITRLISFSIIFFLNICSSVRNSKLHSAYLLKNMTVSITTIRYDIENVNIQTSNHSVKYVPKRLLCL